MLDETVFIIRQGVGCRHDVVHRSREDGCFFVLHDFHWNCFFRHFNLSRSLGGGEGEEVGEEGLEGRVRVEEQELGRQRGWRLRAYRTSSSCFGAFLRDPSRRASPSPS